MPLYGCVLAQVCFALVARQPWLSTYSFPKMYDDALYLVVDDLVVDAHAGHAGVHRRGFPHDEKEAPEIRPSYAAGEAQARGLGCEWTCFRPGTPQLDSLIVGQGHKTHLQL